MKQKDVPVVKGSELQKFAGLAGLLAGKDETEKPQQDIFDKPAAFRDIGESVHFASLSKMSQSISAVQPKEAEEMKISNKLEDSKNLQNSNVWDVFDTSKLTNQSMDQSVFGNMNQSQSAMKFSDFSTNNFMGFDSFVNTQSAQPSTFSQFSGFGTAQPQPQNQTKVQEFKNIGDFSNFGTESASKKQEETSQKQESISPRKAESISPNKIQNMFKFVYFVNYQSEQLQEAKKVTIDQLMDDFNKSIEKAFELSKEVVSILNKLLNQPGQITQSFSKLQTNYTILSFYNCPFYIYLEQMMISLDKSNKIVIKYANLYAAYKFAFTLWGEIQNQQQKSNISKEIYLHLILVQMNIKPLHPFLISIFQQNNNFQIERNIFAKNFGIADGLMKGLEPNLSKIQLPADQLEKVKNQQQILLKSPKTNKNQQTVNCPCCQFKFHFKANKKCSSCQNPIFICNSTLEYSKKEDTLICKLCNSMFSSKQFKQNEITNCPICKLEKLVLI